MLVYACITAFCIISIEFTAAAQAYRFLSSGRQLFAQSLRLMMHQIKDNLGSPSCPHWHFVTFSDIVRWKTQVFRQNVKRIDIHSGHASLGHIVKRTLHFLMWQTAPSWFYRKVDMCIFSNGRREAAQKCYFRCRETKILWVCKSLREESLEVRRALVWSEMPSESIKSTLHPGYI